MKQQTLTSFEKFGSPRRSSVSSTALVRGSDIPPRIAYHVFPQTIGLWRI